MQGGLQPSSSQAALTNPPASASSMQSPEALQRLGRLLAAFLFPIAITAVLMAGFDLEGCKASTPPPADDAVQSQIDIGQQQLADRHFPEAITAFAEALKEQPNDRDALRGTGFAYMSLGRLEQAEPYYRKAIEADPKWSIAKNELAGILLVTKRCEEAEGLFRAVTEDIFYQTPEFAEHNLALALACEGKIKNAVELLEGTVLKRPHFCLAYLTLSQLSAQAKLPERTVKACGDFETNCAQFEKIKDQVTPEMNATCYLRSGKAYVDMGDVESARAALTRCMSTSETIGKDCRELLMMLPR
jgi:Flp pilus assembly protein TadD